MGQKLESIEIIPPEKLKTVENFKVYITSMYADQIKQQLAAMGIANHEIYDPGDAMRPLPFWDTEQGFNALFSEILGRSLVGKTRCFILYQLAKQAVSLNGDLCEVGVYKGGTARLLARTSQASGKTVHLFDTFEGMPETDRQRDIHSKVDFNDTSLEAVKDFLSDCSNVSFYQGMFPETSNHIEKLKFSLVHVDVDIYKSVLDCCSFFYSRLCKGGIIVFDDYGFSSCPGARLAVEEFFSEKKEQTVYLPAGQAVIIKL